MSLTRHVAIATGAGNGIGKAIALALARAGAQVVAVDVNGGAAKVTGDACAARGPGSLALDTDVGDLAALAVFLASPGARNITGQSFNVDGGIIFD